MTTGYVHPRLHHEIVEALKAEIALRDERVAKLGAQTARLELKLELAERNAKGLRSDSAFWRRAAEQAIDGWTKLEDKLDAVVQTLQLIDCDRDPETGGRVIEVLEMLVEDDPLEPGLEEPTSEYAPIELADGQTLRVVEDEKPIGDK